MEQLEGSTLDLIRRRISGSGGMGTMVILTVVGMIVALPLVKVDLVATAAGVITTGQEVMELVSPMAGQVDSCRLTDLAEVSPGDTLLWFSRRVPETRLREYRMHLDRQQGTARDIRAILEGGMPRKTARYIQSHRAQLSGRYRLDVECDFLEAEFLAAQTLYRQEVIPAREYEKARSAYLASLAEGKAFSESYRDRLEGELDQVLQDMDRCRGEIAAIEASLHGYCILAPAGGILHHCPGITRGSVLQPGSSLGSIVPEGPLVAECYVESRVRSDIRPGSAVRVRIDRLSRHPESILETRVSQIDPQSVVMNGKPYYRILCELGETGSLSGQDRPGRVMPGMGFTASLFLGRTRLSSLLLEKLNRWGNPAWSARQDTHPPGHGS